MKTHFNEIQTLACGIIKTSQGGNNLLQYYFPEKTSVFPAPLGLVPKALR
jgi:hypothetical protein